MKNKYKSLLSNTALFFISTFSSKFLVFLLMPVYTKVLAPSEYNTVDLLTKAANLLIPVVSLGIPSAIIRFGLDKKYSKRGVFTTATLTYMFGFMLLLAFYPLIVKITYISAHIRYLYLYLVCSCLRTLVQQFARARMLTRLYAVDGVLATVTTLFFMYLYLIKFNMGAMGYIMAIISSDFLSFLFLATVSGSFKFFKISKVNYELVREMWAFCLPLIPTVIFWWITNASDAFLVRYYISATVSGLYGISYKIPAIINLFSTVFTEAWQISAVKEGQKANSEKFFKNVFRAYQAVIFTAGAGLILICKFLVRIMMADSYYESWKFVPVLIMASVLYCMSTFLASIYLVQKNGKANLLTMMAGAISNIVMNIFLIPRYGAQGAAIATFLSYGIVFILRTIGTKKIIDVDVSPVFLTWNVAFMAALCFVMVAQVKYWAVFAFCLTAAIVALNFSSLKKFILTVLRVLAGSKRRARS